MYKSKFEIDILLIYNIKKGYKRNKKGYNRKILKKKTISINIISAVE